MCCDGRMRKQLVLEDLSVLRCLSEGRFSKVLLVSLQDCGPTQALRVVPKEALCSRRRYQRRILEQLEHPFLVRHLQVFEQPDALCFLQEYCPCGDLALLLRAGALAEHEARPLLGELVLALEFLHRHEITYRDLRPETVLFCRQGQAKLADLDVSVMEREAKESLYFAPECRRQRTPLGLRPVGATGNDRSADWYSLGAVASHVLEGRAPSSRDQLAPKSASVKARNLVAVLTRREAADRLGSCEGDGCDVRSHMFFAGVCFVKLLAGDSHRAAPWRARLPPAEATHGRSASHGRAASMESVPGEDAAAVRPKTTSSARTIIAAPRELQVQLLSSLAQQPHPSDDPTPTFGMSLSRRALDETESSWALWEGVTQWSSRLSGLFVSLPEEDVQDPEASVSVVEVSFTPDRRHRCDPCV